MQLRISPKDLKVPQLTIHRAALAGVLLITALFFAISAGSIAVYYFYPYRALNNPASTEFKPKTVPVSELESLREILKERGRVYQASTTLATPPAFR